MNLTINNYNDYLRVYEYSVEHPEQFWADVAHTFSWRDEWNELLRWNFQEPSVEWFAGAKLNVTYNCLDRHLAENGDKIAFVWEPNDPGEQAKKITYKELHGMVCRFANMLKANGVMKGDRVCIYLPMIPEAVVAMLACARVGATHSVVFAGFSAQSISDRINDSECSIIITADGMMRGDKKIVLKDIVDEALKSCHTIRKCILHHNRNFEVTIVPGRDLWLHDELKKVNEDNEPEWMDAEDPLFILYTSGSTGKPKGVLHTCGGYMVYAGYTFKTVFNYKPHQVFWCTADVGWVTGHSYIVYGPLLNAATAVIFEGIPSWPDAGRFWQVVEKHRVNITVFIFLVLQE